MVLSVLGTLLSMNSEERWLDVVKEERDGKELLQWLAGLVSSGPHLSLVERSGSIDAKSDLGLKESNEYI